MPAPQAIRAMIGEAVAFDRFPAMTTSKIFHAPSEGHCVFIVPSSNLLSKQMIRRKPHALASTPATPKEKTLLAFLIWRG